MKRFGVHFGRGIGNEKQTLLAAYLFGENSALMRMGRGGMLGGGVLGGEKGV